MKGAYALVLVLSVTDEHGCEMGVIVSSRQKPHFSQKPREMGQPALRVGEVFNHFRNGVELTDAVTGFNSGYLVGIGNQRRFKSVAMPFRFFAHALEFLDRRPLCRPSPA
jgi:hypothetical protein